jgi:uncharacterized NAD(P)/FAD-binding protein YdhS
MPTEKELLDTLSHYVKEAEEVRLATLHTVLVCREAGLTWQDIADRLCMSRQGAYKKYGHYERAQRPTTHTSMPLFIEGKP